MGEKRGDRGADEGPVAAMNPPGCKARVHSAAPTVPHGPPLHRLPDYASRS